MPNNINVNNSVNDNKLSNIPLNLEAGQINTLAFAKDAISSMQLTPQHSLEITFKDGSKLNINNFEELANSFTSHGRETLIQLSDGSLIKPQELYEQLTKSFVVSPVNNNDIITAPIAGEMKKVDVAPAHEYKFGFNFDDVRLSQSGNDLLITFKDGGILILGDYFPAAASELPPVMTMAGGVVVDPITIIASVKANDVTKIEPASGDVLQNSTAKSDAQNVANIEPAAGDNGGVKNASGGFGFGSAIDPANFSSSNPIGAIAPTLLNYAAPEITTIPYVSGAVGSTIIDYNPVIANIASGAIDETKFNTINGTVTADFGGDAPKTSGAFSFNNGFTVGGSVAGQSLTSHGVPVVVTNNGNTYTGTAGGQTVFTITIDPITGAYTYTQTKPFDHADGANPNDVINLGFGVDATDNDGDIGTSIINVSVYDDAPVAVNDTVQVGSNPLTVSGNVVTNDNFGQDGMGSVTKVTFAGVAHNVPAGGSVTVVGVYGTLVINDKGEYTYTSSNKGLGSDEYLYTIVDFDGDQASANLTVTVNDLDELPCIENAYVVMDETGIGVNGKTVSGDVHADYLGDGPGVVAGTGIFTSGGSKLGGALTSNGVPVVVALVGDTYTAKAGSVTVFTLKVNLDGTFTYTQFAALDHANGSNPDDVINLEFGVKATDADGDVVEGTISVDVRDDAPVAVDDVATLGSAPGSVTGNVTANDSVGLDKPGYVVKTVTFGTTSVDVPATGTVNIIGAHGTLTISANGAYTYTGSSVGADVFGYKIVDRDGDSDLGQLTVTVNDVDTTPVAQNSTITVDESNISGAPQVVNGTISVDYKGDGAGAVSGTGVFTSDIVLKSNGVPVVVALVGDTYVGKAGDKTVFTLKINTNGTYTYTQIGQLDHADGANPNDAITLNFGFAAPDADGDVANGSIIVTVRDDAPVAVNDSNNVVDANIVVGGNVLTNDTIGLDKPGFGVVSVSFGGTVVNVPATGTVNIVGAHGTLTISANGAYTFAANGQTMGIDAFTYTIKDSDGDVSSATLSVVVSDVDSSPCGCGVTLSVDETNITINGTSQVITGTMVQNYYGEGPGVVAGNGSFTSGGSQTGGALTSNGVPVVVTMSGNTYTGVAGGKTIFTLTLAANGAYTYTQIGQLDHADGANSDDVINLSFGFKATDIDGDTTNGTIIVKVYDGTPVAVDDAVTVNSTTHIASGNVTSNDNVGLDKPGYVVKTVTFGATSVDVPATGTINIVGAHGTLTISATGAYTYTGSSVGLDTFIYKIVDRDGDSAVANLNVNVPVIHLPPETPNVTARDVVVLEDNSVALNISASAVNGNGNEVLTVTVSGIKSGWGVDTSVSGGTYNSATGVWTVTLPAGQAFNGGPTVSPPVDSDADLTGLLVKASVYDPDTGVTVNSTTTTNVITDAVADVPTLGTELNVTVINNVSSIDFSLDAALNDVDGSEVLQVRIEGLPSNLSLSVGAYDAVNGYWVLTAAQAAGNIHVNTPLNYTGQFSLVVTAVARETNFAGAEPYTNNNVAYTTSVMNVAVNAPSAEEPVIVDTNTGSNNSNTTVVNVVSNPTETNTTVVNSGTAVVNTNATATSNVDVDVSSTATNYGEGSASNNTVVNVVSEPIATNTTVVENVSGAVTVDSSANATSNVDVDVTSTATNYGEGSASNNTVVNVVSEPIATNNTVVENVSGAVTVDSSANATSNVDVDVTSSAANYGEGYASNNTVINITSNPIAINTTTINVNEESVINYDDVLDLSNLIDNGDNLTTAINNFVFAQVANGNNVVNSNNVNNSVITNDVTIDFNDVTQNIYQQQNGTGIV